MSGSEHVLRLLPCFCMNSRHSRSPSFPSTQSFPEETGNLLSASPMQIGCTGLISTTCGNRKISTLFWVHAETWKMVTKEETTRTLEGKDCQ